MKKKLISIVATAAMAMSLVMVPMTANAETLTAQKLYKSGDNVLELTGTSEVAIAGAPGAANDNAYSAIRTWNAGTKLTINGTGKLLAKQTEVCGGFDAAVFASSGSEIIINGGEYENQADPNDPYHVDLIYAESGAKITINGGTFTDVTPKWTLNCKDNSGSLITVKGGRFYKFDPANADVGAGEVVVADGYVSVQDGDWYEVVPVEVKAEAPKAPTSAGTTVVAGASTAAVEAIKTDALAVVEAVAAGDAATGIDAATAEKVKQALLDEKTITASVTASNIEVAKVPEAAKTAITNAVKKFATDEKKAATIAQYLDLGVMLKADGTDLGNVTALSAPVEFAVTVPTDIQKSGREYYIVRLHDGEAEVLPASDVTYANGILTFKTDKFSTYALAYNDEATVANPAGTVTQPKDTTGTTGTPAAPGNTGSQTGTVKTGDATDMSLYLGMSLVAMIAALGLIFKKLRTDK